MISLSRFTMRSLVFIALIILVLVSCSPLRPPLVTYWPHWKYTDLHLLDPVDSEDLDVDLIAIYTRRSGNEVQVRLDLLELKEDTKFELFLAFDTRPGSGFMSTSQDTPENNNHDILISSDINGNLKASSMDPARRIERLRLVRDTENDAVVISFSANSSTWIANSGTYVTAWIRTAAFEEPVDYVIPIKFNAAPPKQANVMLYFWNTFAAATPAQALRNWDGAHAGPQSARHGLNHLLDAVENTNIPVILADLKTPENLSALDYMVNLDKIHQMANANLIDMPDVSSINLSDQPVLSLPDWVYPKELQWAHQVALDFKMLETQALVAYQWPSSLPVPDQYHLLLPFQVIPFSTASLCSQGHVKVLCEIISNDDTSLQEPFSQVDNHGLAIEAKKEILGAALSEENSILFLGGDLNISTWGIQVAPGKALSYIRNHPWIRVLTLNDLLTWKTTSKINHPVTPPPPKPFVPVSVDGEPIKSGNNTQEINSQVLAELERLPESELAKAAWEWYFELLSSRSNLHHRLNAATLGQVGHLIAGAQWSVEPHAITTCSIDLDWDGEYECILASSTFFSSFEVQGGALVIGLLRTPGGIQQVFGPTYQVYSGISDPFLWKTDQGYLGDPDAVGGVFIEHSLVGTCCSARVVENYQIEFLSLDMTMRKLFSLEESALQVNYFTQSTTIVSGSIVNNPWDRFYPGWADKYPSYKTFEGNSDFHLGSTWLSSNSEQNSGLFTTSKEYLDEPEDPNLDYTSGHNLLFPFGNFTVTGNGEFWIRLEWPK